MDESPQPTGKHVVVGHDGHSAAQAALDVAVELAAGLDAHLHVVHSVTLADFGIDPETDEFVKQRDRNLAEERDAISDALVDAPIGWTYHEEDGDPADRLAELATELDAPYIVVGATHRGLHLSSGSVPKRLLHIQQRPVVVVPEPPSAEPPPHKRWLAARGR
jgi:nucleotide-binding universal stress UspA family protein